MSVEMQKEIQSILFICMGNICRSPAAHAVMEKLNQEHGLGWHIDSCGTDTYHIGASPDARMQKVLKQHGYPKFFHKSQMFRIEMAYNFDLLLAMDMNNYESIRGQINYEETLRKKLYLFRDFDPQVGTPANSPSNSRQRAEVPDPYYNGEQSFRAVYQMIVRTCENLVYIYGKANTPQRTK